MIWPMRASITGRTFQTEIRPATGTNGHVGPFVQDAKIILALTQTALRLATSHADVMRMLGRLEPGVLFGTDAKSPGFMGSGLRRRASSGEPVTQIYVLRGSFLRQEKDDRKVNLWRARLRQLRRCGSTTRKKAPRLRD